MLVRHSLCCLGREANALLSTISIIMNCISSRAKPSTFSACSTSSSASCFFPSCFSLSLLPSFLPPASPCPPQRSHSRASHPGGLIPAHATQPAPRPECCRHLRWHPPRRHSFDRNDMFRALMRDFMALATGHTPDTALLPRLDRVYAGCALIADAWAARQFRGTTTGGIL